MKRIALTMSVAAFLALPVASASAADIPDVHCGIVSCTDPIERAQEVGDDVVECARGTVTAYWHAINGYPQMYYCEFG